MQRGRPAVLVNMQELEAKLCQLLVTIANLLKDNSEIRSFRRNVSDMRLK